MAETKPHDEETANGPMPSETPHPLRLVQKCGAASRTKGGAPCTQPAMPNGRCKMHGGKSHPGGPGHPGIRHGRYSKFLPERLQERYEQAAGDPELLSTREDVALLQARIGELTAKLYSGESTRLWNELRRQWKAYRGHKASADEALRRGNDDRQRECLGLAADTLDSIGRLITAGSDEARTWEELKKTLQEKAKLAKVEWGRLVDLKSLITVEQANVFALALLNSVIRHVPDTRTRAAINRDFKEALTNHPSAHALGVPPTPDVEVHVIDDADHPTVDVEVVECEDNEPAGTDPDPQEGGV